jgi:hypothetical protein
VDVDGVQLGTSCKSSITFKSSGAGDVTSLGASSVRRSESAARSFSVRMWVRSVAPNNDPKASRRLTVEVGSADPCSGDSAGPVVSLIKPKAGEQYPSPNPYPVRFEASADDATTGGNGISLVEFKASSPTSAVLATVSSGPPWTFNWEASAINGYLNGSCNQDVTVRAYAVDRCGNSTFSAPVTIKLNVSTVCDVGSGSRPAAPTSQLLTRLALTGGAGQVVLNGEASFPRSGRSALAARLAPGENRVEATLVEGRSPGTWGFELGTIPGLVPASLRVVAGEAVQVSADAVVFRLQGRPGERVVFSFEVE